MTLREFIELVARPISDRFMERGEIKPMYHIICCDGRDLVAPGLPGDKDLAVAVARALMEVVGATRYVFITEAWMLLADGEDVKKIDLAKVDAEGVEAQPGRKEVLLFNAEDAREGMIMAHREIIRDGARATLGPLEVFASGYSEGRMIGLLPRGKLAS
jgi:hypothetical protein